MSDELLKLRRRHLRFGWYALLGFLILGAFLEGLHGFKAGFYLDVTHETRRLMWRLAHAHGTLLALVNIAFALSLGTMATIARYMRSSMLEVVHADYIKTAFAKGLTPSQVVWRHQVRWSRTIRVSRTSGYYGYVVTHATLWGIVAIAAGQWQAGALALAARMAAGIVVGRGVLRDRGVSANWWLIPLRDLFGFAVWLGGLFGNHVLWRGKRLRLSPDGRIGR